MCPKCGNTRLIIRKGVQYCERCGPLKGPR